MAAPLVNPVTPATVFIDTNVLLYAASDGKEDPQKKRLAEELLMVVNPFAEQGRWIREDPPRLHELK
jgi:predicted nucleic acid-binding protein